MKPEECMSSSRNYSFHGTPPNRGCLYTSTPDSIDYLRHTNDDDFDCSDIREQYFEDSFHDQSIASEWLLTTDESDPLPQIGDLETDIDKKTLDIFNTSQETVKSLNRNEEQTKRNSSKHFYNSIASVIGNKIQRKPNILNRKLSTSMKSKVPQTTAEKRKMTKKFFRMFKKSNDCNIHLRNNRKQNIRALRCVPELKEDSSMKTDIFSLNNLFRNIMMLENNGRNGKLNINVLPPNKTVAGTYNIVLSNQEKNTQSEYEPSPVTKRFGTLRSMKTTESCNFFQYSSLLNTLHDKRNNAHEEDSLKLTNKLGKVNDQDDDEEERGRESEIEVTSNKTEEEEEEEEDDSDYEEERISLQDKSTEKQLTEFNSVLLTHMNESKQKLPPSSQGQCISNIPLNTAIDLRKSQEDKINDSNISNDDSKISLKKEPLVEDRKIEVQVSIKLINDAPQTTAVPKNNLTDKTMEVQLEECSSERKMGSEDSSERKMDSSERKMSSEDSSERKMSSEDANDISLNSLLKDMSNEYRNDLHNSESSFSDKYSSSPRKSSSELCNSNCLSSGEDSGYYEKFTEICNKIHGTNTQTTDSCGIVTQTNTHTTPEDEESILKSLPLMNNHDTSTRIEDSKLDYQKNTNGEDGNKTESKHSPQKLLCTSLKIDEDTYHSSKTDIDENTTSPQMQISIRNSQEKDLKIKNAHDETESLFTPENVSQKKPSDEENCSLKHKPADPNISLNSGKHNLSDKVRSSEMKECIQQNNICLQLQDKNKFHDSDETNHQSRTPFENNLSIEKKSETEEPAQQMLKQSCVVYKGRSLSGNEPGQKTMSSVPKKGNLIQEMNSPGTKYSFQQNKYTIPKQTNSVFEQKALEIQKSIQGNSSLELPQISSEKTKTLIIQNSAQDKNMMEKIPYTNTSITSLYPPEYTCVFTDLQKNTETFIAGDIGTQEEIVYMIEDEKKGSRKKNTINQDLSFTLQRPIMTRSRTRALKELEEEIIKESVSINKAKHSSSTPNESEEFQNVDRMVVFPTEQITGSHMEENPKPHHKKHKEHIKLTTPIVKSKEKKSDARGKGCNSKLDSVMTYEEMKSKKQFSNSMAEFDVLEEEQIIAHYRRTTKKRTPWAGRTRSCPVTFNGCQKKTDKRLICDENAENNHSQTKGIKKQAENNLKNITAKKQRTKDLQSNERKPNLDQIENDWKINAELETKKQTTVEKEFVSVLKKSFELPVAENQMKGNQDLKRIQRTKNYDEEINVTDDMKEATDVLLRSETEPCDGPNDRILELDSHYRNGNMFTSVTNDRMNSFSYTSDQNEELINPTFMSWATDKKEVVVYQEDDSSRRRGAIRRQSVSRCRGTGRAKPEKPFVCTICGDRHQYEAVLEDHYRMYHNLSFSN